MTKLLKYIKGYALICAILAPLTMAVEVFMDLLQPTLMANIIDIGIANRDLSYVIKTSFTMLITSGISFIGGISCSFLAVTAALKMGENLRFGVFSKIQTLSFLEIDKFKTSSLITRLTNDITQVQNIVLMGLRMMVRAPLLAIGGLFMAISLSSKLSITLLFSVPIIVFAVILILKKSMPLFKVVQEKLDNINIVMRESILGIRVIKSFNIEKHQENRFDEVNSELMNNSIRSQNINLTLWPISALVMNLSVVAVLWIGGNMVNTGDIEIGKIMAFINYLMQIMNSIIMVIGMSLSFSKAKVSADRINEVLDTQSSINDTKNPIRINNFDIEFKNVSFKYNENSEHVLENISFKAKQGEKIGIIGSTGCGKSTLISLIPRLYDVSEGEVLIGGVNVSNISLRELRDNIGVVLQDSILFSGTIEDNLKFGNKLADINMMEDASRDAQAYEFINSKEERYQSVVEQRGKNLSGGQKQRLSIARTLIKNPKILIMDDSSSALDMQTESYLQESIKNRMKNSTIITIAQRISGVMDCDKIIVLEDGKISDIGTHNELLLHSEIYRSIAISQLGEEVAQSV